MSSRSIRGRIARPRLHPFPRSLEEYAPDPTQPIDRWWQVSNSSNARSTAKIIRTMAPISPHIIIDPFAGAGSTAVAARTLGVPFVGMEIDPLLATITTAKAMTVTSHVERIRTLSKGERENHNAETLKSLLLEAEGDPALGALLYVMLLRAAVSPLTCDELTTDLAGKRVRQPTTVICGDATSQSNWESLAHACDRAVIYTSPPFGGKPIVPQTDEATRALASRIMKCDPEIESHRCGNVSNATYTDLVVKVAKAAQKVVTNSAMVIEHEPHLETGDRRLDVAQRLNDETGWEVIDILQTRTFSRRGPLSFLVCLLRE